MKIFKSTHSFEFQTGRVATPDWISVATQNQQPWKHGLFAGKAESPTHFNLAMVTN